MGRRKKQADMLSVNWHNSCLCIVEAKRSLIGPSWMAHGNGLHCQCKG